MRIFKLDITTKDLWTGTRGLEISWGERLIYLRGFKDGGDDTV